MNSSLFSKKFAFHAEAAKPHFHYIVRKRLDDFKILPALRELFPGMPGVGRREIKCVSYTAREGQQPRPCRVGVFRLCIFSFDPADQFRDDLESIPDDRTVGRFHDRRIGLGVDGDDFCVSAYEIESEFIASSDSEALFPKQLNNLRRLQHLAH